MALSFEHGRPASEMDASSLKAPLDLAIADGFRPSTESWHGPILSPKLPLRQGFGLALAPDDDLAEVERPH